MSMYKRMTCQQAVTILVPRVGTRTGFRYQNFTDETGKVRYGLLTGDPDRSTGTITISDATFGTVDVPSCSMINVLNTTMTAGIIITINGNPLEGTVAPRVPGTGDDAFCIGAADVIQEIVDAINDASNSFAADIVASIIAEGENQIKLEAVTPGYISNNMAITSSIPEEILVSDFSGGGQSAGKSKLYIGDMTLVPGLDWEVVEGNINASAHNLTDSISRISGYSATHLAGVIDVLGPTGSSFNPRFEALNVGTTNFEVSPEDGKINVVGQTLGPIGII